MKVVAWKATINCCGATTWPFRSTSSVMLCLRENG